jgi:glycosyltransferase involved in cell wall biosynthesis
MMLKLPLVSIVIPLYNKAPYVLRTLESVAAQTVVDFEAIVVDDGSTDGSADLVAKFPDPRFRLLRQGNAGPGAARNRGLREVSAPHVAFIDADDVWSPQFLEENLALLERYPAAAALTCGWTKYPNGAMQTDSWRARGVEEGLFVISQATTPDRLFAMLAYMNPSTVIAKSEVIRRWGGFHEDRCLYGEDTTLWLKILLNEPLYFHLRPLAKLDVDASELCRNYRSARPIEPFLIDPGILRNACPKSLLPLLERLLKMLACKTAAVLGFWGEWRQARQLTRRFVSPSDWRTPLFIPAVMSSSPLIAPVGWVARSFVKR